MVHFVQTSEISDFALKGEALIDEIGGLYLHYAGGESRSMPGTGVDYALVIWMDKDGNLLYGRPSRFPDIYAEISTENDPYTEDGYLLDDDAHRDELYDSIVEMLKEVGIPSDKIPSDFLGRIVF